MISLSGICKKGLLSDISFCFEGGSLCIISKDRAAVKAIADIICKIRVPDSGTVGADGLIPLLSEGMPFPGYLKVRELYDMLAGLRGVRNIPDDVKVAAGNYYNQTLRNLTALEKAKVGVMSLFISGPESSDAVFAENPSLGLNPAESREIFSLILSESNPVPVIYTTESFEELEMSGYVLVIDRGKTFFFGKTERFLELLDESADMFTVRVAGNKESVLRLFSKYGEDISEEDGNEGVFSVRFSVSQSGIIGGVRAIKKLVREASLTFIDAKRDNSSVRNLISELKKNDDLRRKEFERFKKEHSEPKKIDSSLTAFVHEDEELDESDEDSAEGGVYAEDDASADEYSVNDWEDGESTLFSGGNDEKK